MRLFFTFTPSRLVCYTAVDPLLTDSPPTAAQHSTTNQQNGEKKGEKNFPSSPSLSLSLSLSLFLSFSFFSLSLFLSLFLLVLGIYMDFSMVPLIARDCVSLDGGIRSGIGWTFLPIAVRLLLANRNYGS